MLFNLQIKEIFSYCSTGTVTENEKYKDHKSMKNKNHRMKSQLLLTLFILVLDPLQFIIKTYNNIITRWNARICLETISIANEPSG